MSEKEYHFIRILKKWVIGLGSTTVIVIISALLFIWQVGIVNGEKMSSMQKAIDKQEISINEKASMKMVVAVKETLEKQLVDKIDGVKEQVCGVKGQLDIIISMLPYAKTTNNFNGKNNTSNNK